MAIPKVARISISKAVEAVLLDGVRKAIVYQHPQLVITATRRNTAHGGPSRFNLIEVSLTIGKADSRRKRRFIKDCLAAGEPFPVKKVQLEWFKAKE